MRKTILQKFILVLLAALFLNSVIFYIASSYMILEHSGQDMMYTLESMDSLFDYNENLEQQMSRLDPVMDKNFSRLTMIRADGTVAADTEADAAGLDNHLGREEVVRAVEEGRGDARRYSDTLNQTMLYAAMKSANSDMVLRLSVPYSGMREYLPMLFPAAIISFLMALGCSFVVTKRFVSSVTKRCGIFPGRC